MTAASHHSAVSLDKLATSLNTTGKAIWGEVVLVLVYYGLVFFGQQTSVGFFKFSQLMYLDKVLFGNEKVPNFDHLDECFFLRVTLGIQKTDSEDGQHIPFEKA